MSDAETRAAQAKRLLDDPILQEAFANVRNGAIEVWTRTKADAQQEREIAWLTVKVIDRITSEFEAIVTNGKIAAARVQNPLR